MCNLEKIQSSFKFKGKLYKVHFVVKDDMFSPIVEEFVFSFLGLKIWKVKETSRQINLTKEEVYSFKMSDSLKVIGFLREYARGVMGTNVQIV